MSSFVGILVVGGQALHLVDWNRPVWFDPDNVEGLRVIPDPDHFVADAVIVMREGALADCSHSCERDLAGLNDLVERPCEHLERARTKAYADFATPMVFLHSNNNVDSLISSDLVRFRQAKHTLAQMQSQVL